MNYYWMCMPFRRSPYSAPAGGPLTILDVDINPNPPKMGERIAITVKYHSSEPSYYADF